jgi:pimeloyl-ACP methyl ester carboxylesterase
MIDQTTLLLFPGLGVDARVFEPQRRLPFRLEFAQWIEPESADETLSHYAQRMAGAIGPRTGLYVGGISLGAMVALEAARLLDVRGVFLIGGCTSHRQISPLFRTLLATAARMPVRSIRPSLLLAPMALKLFERLGREHVSLMTRMLREHSATQTRWSCRAILQWECCAVPPQVPVHAIHGQDDEVIPLKNVQVDCAVPHGRHLINLAHADAVNRFIAERVISTECRCC